MNQYLAKRGFVVLSVNYRLGIGYGHEFTSGAPRRGGRVRVSGRGGRGRVPRHSAGGPARIGIWAAYGGFLTALALARTRVSSGSGPARRTRLDRDGGSLLRPPRVTAERRTSSALVVAWTSSPVSSVETWKSPVLLIQGDDDPRALQPDRRPRASAREAGTAIRGAGAPRRDPRLPASCVVAHRGCGDGGVLQSRAQGDDAGAKRDESLTAILALRNNLGLHDEHQLIGRVGRTAGLKIERPARWRRTLGLGAR